MRARSVLVTLAVVATSAPAARADDKKTCLDAYVQGQELRRTGKLRAASEKFLQCAQTTCPDLARADCSKWLSDVNASLATVVVDVRDASGKRIETARLFVDDKPQEERLDGAPVKIDPGAHTLRVEASGSPPAEQVVVLKTGEKDHVVTLTVGGAASSSSSSTSSAEGDGGPSRPIPTVALVLAGVSVVSAASFAYFGLSGRAAEDDLQACKPFCETDRVDAVKGKYLVADVSLGVSVLALGAAAYFYLTRPTAPPQAGRLSFDVGATARSTSLSLTYAP